MLERPGTRKRRRTWFRLLVVVSLGALVGVALWLYPQAERLVTGERAEVLSVRQCSTRPSKGAPLYTCPATWRFSDGRTGEGDVDAGAERTRKGSVVFAGDRWGYDSREELTWDVALKGVVVLLILGELTVLLAMSRSWSRRSYKLPRGI
ncbi:hypothetical protein ABZ848_14450 [Streptomyces sp. NPDC047081]|uniref:hypothetical protein n=1 Tax=Streptomyces sp. NPDC047081 TaxID=3154706 RepID=UPI0033FF7BD7